MSWPSRPVGNYPGRDYAAGRMDGNRHVEPADSPDPDRPRRIGTLLARWGVAAAGLWAVGMLLCVQAEFLWPWGPVQGLVGLLFRAAEVVSTPAAPIAHRLVGDPWEEHVIAYYSWRFGLASVVLGLGLALLGSLSRRSRRVAGPRGSRGMTRRQLVTRGTAAAAGVAVAAPAVWASVVVPGRLRLRRYEVLVHELPARFDGLTLAHLSDTHFGPWVSRGHIRRAIELANAQEPDLAVLTGDYVHRTPRSVETGIGLFAELRARFGSVAVMGNHDHFMGADACRRRFAELDIPLLENATRFLTPAGLGDEEVPDESLALVGMADYTEDRPAPRMATRFISPLCPRLLLSHHPDVAERFPTRFPELYFDLQLSGHTHGGQVRLPGHGAPLIPSDFGQKYAGGRVEGPAWPVIVSRGVGMAVSPVRFGVDPEIGLIVLRRA